MKIKETLVRKLVLTELDDLDPITMILEDYGPGRGKLTVECFGDAWSAFWPAIGQCDVARFVARASTDYIASKLSNVRKHVTDYEKIAKDIGVEDIEDITLLLHEKQVAEAYGEDWMHSLPQKVNPQYEYLCRVVGVVRLACERQLQAATS